MEHKYYLNETPYFSDGDCNNDYRVNQAKNGYKAFIYSLTYPFT